jgi:hypothetical protein
MDANKLIRFLPEEINTRANGTPDPQDMDRHIETDNLIFRF